MTRVEISSRVGTSRLVQSSARRSCRWIVIGGESSSRECVSCNIRVSRQPTSVFGRYTRFKAVLVVCNTQIQM